MVEHPDAEIYLSQPGLGVVLGARVLAEFGDDKNRYADAKARKNYAGTSPITRQSGKRKTVLARYVHNDRLVDALGLQAFAALTRFTRRPRLLRPTPRPRHRPPRRATPARQPPRRHPPRLPQDRHHTTTKHTAWAHRTATRRHTERRRRTQRRYAGTQAYRQPTMLHRCTGQG